MNIFVLSESPIESAKMMIDKHVVKMPTETCQMLHTNVLYIQFIHNAGRKPELKDLKKFHKNTNSTLMKPAMMNHPSTVWARESEENFKWLYNHGIALCDEYYLRYRKEHGARHRMMDCTSFIKNDWFKFPATNLTPFAIAISSDMNCRKHPNFENMNTIEKYRTYYLEDKWKFASWKTKSPEWWPNNHIQKKDQEWNNWLESENERIRKYNNER